LHPFQRIGVATRLRWLLLSAVVLASSLSSTKAARRERLIDSWQPTHYSVQITFNDQLNEIAARTELTIQCLKDDLSLIDLDFGALDVDAVTVDNHPSDFEHSNELLKVKLPRPVARGTRLIVAVAYHGKPADGLILTKDKDGKPSAVGDNWPNRVHHWIPSLDHAAAKATVSFTVTVPARDLVVANGKLVQMQCTNPTSRTWSFVEAAPIPPYCMIVAVGEFAQLEPKSYTVTPLSYVVPKSDKRFAMQGFAPAIPSLKFFSQTIAPYPYEKLALIVGATRFGGMENSSAIVFSSTLFSPTHEAISNVFKIREGIVSVVAHEIAHQWFGDSVTESTWADLWLSEGFATYFAGLFIQKHEGEQAFRRYMKEAADAYFMYEKQQRKPIYDTETEDLMQLLNPNNYQKGAWVLHMLRSRLGDESFFRGLRAYYSAHKNSTASSEDLRRALEQASGLDLKEFFEQWIYGSGHPEYDLRWDWNNDKGIMKLHLKQVQPEPYFANWLPVDLITGKIKSRVIFKPSAKDTIIELSLKQQPSSVAIDPEGTVLKEVLSQQEGG